MPADQGVQATENGLADVGAEAFEQFPVLMQGFAIGL
jgi:hypothetical protein